MGVAASPRPQAPGRRRHRSQHRRHGRGVSGPRRWSGDRGAVCWRPSTGRHCGRCSTPAHPFRGALYAGLMLTADGPRLLEFNVRFGDPETQAILPRLREPIGPLLLAAAGGRLAAEFGSSTSVRADPDSVAVAVVLAASGYPGPPATGDPISGTERARRGALVFHGGTGIRVRPAGHRRRAGADHRGPGRNARGRPPRGIRGRRGRPVPGSAVPPGYRPPTGSARGVRHPHGTGRSRRRRAGR